MGNLGAEVVGNASERRAEDTLRCVDRTPQLVSERATTHDLGNTATHQLSTVSGNSTSRSPHGRVCNTWRCVRRAT